jgi:uncharacterized phiE125 gp8 family phage protein
MWETAMRRTIIEPADLGGPALAELKDWLGISRANEDELLTAMLQASLAMCEDFTGQAPLTQRVEERVPPDAGQTCLFSRPVTALHAAEIVAQDGTRTLLEPAGYGFALQADGIAVFDLASPVTGQAVALRVDAGIAQSWQTVPAALRQGMIRLAAFHYRERDRTGSPAAASQPPASVSALWRPWRTMRLA